MTPQDAIDQLTALGDADKASAMRNSYKIDRPYLGVSNPEIDTLYKQWRLDVEGIARTELAAELWDSNIHEARIAAAKLLTQARINPDGHVWDEISRWVPEFDHAIIADQACGAGARRLMAHPDRFDQVATWVQDENMWVRRSAFTMTMPLTKLNNPKAADYELRDRVLSWAAELSTDSEWLIQRAIATWLMTLSKHDAPRVLTFLENHGAALKPFAVTEACKFL